MNANPGIAAPSRSTRPMVRARIARAFRDLAALRGWQFLVNRLVPDHFASFIIRNGDAVFGGNIGSFIDRQVYLFGGYESGQIRCFLSRIPAGRHRTILDVGANAGTHSLAFARVFETVHAFEPNPMLCPQFERNMALNGHTNVCLHKLGLADILQRDRPVIWCEIGAGTLVRIATTGELSKLVPFEFRCFQIASSSDWAGNSVGLRERSGDLVSGDYMLIPGSWPRQGEAY